MDCAVLRHNGSPHRSDEEEGGARRSSRSVCKASAVMNMNNRISVHRFIVYMSSLREVVIWKSPCSPRYADSQSNLIG